MTSTKNSPASPEKRHFCVQSPQYLRDFSCVGSACIDNCCRYWQINLTRSEVQFYHDKVTDPELKELLRASVKERPGADPRKESNFGYIQLTKNGICPVLAEDGLCRIHARLGSSALSRVCGTYPRQQIFLNRDKPRIEQYGTISCPEVARLLMLGPDALALAEIEVEGDDLRVPGTAMIDGRRETIAGRRFTDIRTAIRALFRAHEADVDAGVFAVVMLAHALSQHAGAAAAETTWLAERVKLYASRDFAAGFRALKPDPSVAFSMLQALVRLRFQEGGVPRPYLDLVGDSLDGLSFDPGDQAASLDAYIRARDGLAGQICAQPWAMRNVAMSMLESSGFPVNDGADLWAGIVVFAVRYSVLRMILTGLAARQGGPLDPDAAIRACYIYARIMDHSRSFLEGSIRMLEQKGLATLAGIAVLIRG